MCVLLLLTTTPPEGFLSQSKYTPPEGCLFTATGRCSSGFLMVFVPDLSMAAGPGMICWMLVCNCFTYMATFIYPTLSRLGRGRNYLGPNDFTSDRYNSSLCRAIASFGGGFSAYMVLTIEWIILKLITSWLFGGTGNLPTWCLGVFILVCESLGGMNSVALTDALQARCPLDIVH